jgi:hypothetical protein
MKFFYAEFTGKWPVPAVILAVARNREFAQAHMNYKLKQEGHDCYIDINDVQEMSQDMTEDEYARIITDGEY